VAFETIAAYARPLAIGVVMTGMGNDAAKGAKAVKAAGGYVIAQDEATSMIFGMPSEAIQVGAVDEVLPLDSIAGALEKRVAKLGRLAPVIVR
jgi:two-component system, chemotaxis family, protein-glutamate methylesterase/glutaminase